MGRINRTVRTTKIRRNPDGSFESDTRADSIATEEALEVRWNKEVVTTMMRTPGHDLELIHGFLHSEGIITSPRDILRASYCGGSTLPDGGNAYNAVNLTPAAHLPQDSPLERLQPVNSACGACGSASTEAILNKTYRPIKPIKLNPELVLELPQMLRLEQKQFKRTGGMHAAGVFETDGTLLVAREDIGRHNAADKVIGHLLLEGKLDAPGRILVMSSRASFELVQKAIMAGFSALITVSAASSYAVELAREAGFTLIAFTRDDRFNLYNGQLDM